MPERQGLVPVTIRHNVNYFITFPSSSRIEIDAYDSGQIHRSRNATADFVAYLSDSPSFFMFNPTGGEYIYIL